MIGGGFLSKFPYQWFAKHVALLWTNAILVLVSATFLTILFRTMLLPQEVRVDFPLNFVFRTCNLSGVCSYPHADIYLTKADGELLLERGISYGIDVELEFPDSDQNRNAGMFLLVLMLQNEEGKQVKIYQKSAVLRYRSTFVRLVRMFFLFPLFLVGVLDETVHLNVNFVDDYSMASTGPVLGASVELQHSNMQVYKSSLKIIANLKGVRYFLYYWPITSTVSLFLVILGFLFSLSCLYWLIKSLASVVHANSSSDDLNEEDETVKSAGIVEGEKNKLSVKPPKKSGGGQHGARTFDSSSGKVDNLDLFSYPTESVGLKKRH